VEEFYYRVGETKVGCEFKCINLLNFNDSKKGNGQASIINKELLQKMKQEKSLLPFVIEAHLKVLDADIKSSGKGELAKQIADEALTEMSSYGFDDHLMRKFAKFLVWLVGSDEKETNNLGGYMLNVQQNNNVNSSTVFHEMYRQKLEDYFVELYYKKVEANKDLQDKLVHLEKELEARKKEEEVRKKEEEARKKEEEVRKKELEVLKKLEEARKKDIAKVTYMACKFRHFNPQNTMSKEEFIASVKHLNTELLENLVEFAEENAKSFEEVLELAKKLEQSLVKK